MANKTFNNIQVFFNFLHEIQNGVWGKTKQPPEVLFSNLDPNGNTNMAIELAKIYSWANETLTFQPYTLLTEEPNPWDPTQYYTYNSTTHRYEKGTAGDAWALSTWYALNSNPVAIDPDAIPDYEFRTSSTWGAFDVREPGGTWQTIGVKLLDPVTNKIPEDKLPSYVDDVIEGYYHQTLLTEEPTSFDPTKYYKIVDGKYVKGSVGDTWALSTWYTPQWFEDSSYTTRIVGESGKIYVATDTNKTYRYSHPNYVEISASLALGETAQTAYRGDRGAQAYTHAEEYGKRNSSQRRIRKDG